MFLCLFCVNCKYRENCEFDPGLHCLYCNHCDGGHLPDCVECERGEPECFEYDDAFADVLNDPDCPF